MHTQNYKPKSIVWSLLMLICALELPGCAATSTVRAPAECPNLPSRPALTQPLPSVMYSESAQQELTSLQAAMQRWQQRLTGMRLTPSD